MDDTTTRKFGGTGLGLAITKDLVRMMRGEIGVNSTEGEGSTFCFKIQFSIAEELHQDLKETYKNLGAEAKGDTINKITSDMAKVLVAEDHELNQVLVKKLLKRMNFMSYTMVDNGLSAVEEYESGGYDLILMDCHMPEMNGYQATEHIRSIEKEKGNTHIPIIALTADAMVGTREKCIEKGMDDYVSKPIDPNLLKDALSQWIIFIEENS